MKHRKILLFFLGIGVILFLNSLHTTYPDEFDNILGGKLILQGILPYSGFFSHHGPLAYFLAAPMVLLGGISFIHFRILSAIFFLALFAVTYLIVNRRFALLYFAAVAVSATFFWGNMFLADPLSGFLLVPAYGLLLVKAYSAKRLTVSDLIIISGFTFAAVINSMTYIYAGAVIYLAGTLLYLTKKDFLKRALSLFLIFALPYFVFFLYLLATGSLRDFYFDAVVYNQKYYIYNYPRPAGSTLFNPIRYGVVIATRFFDNFTTAAMGIKDLNLAFPLTSTLALANLVFWAYLVIRRRFLLFATSFFLLAFVNARGNPAEIKPTDYQTSVYFILTLFNSSFVITLIHKEVETIKNLLAKWLLVFLGVVFVVYWFFAIVYLFREFWGNVYDRYMGTLPLIYDRPAVAPIVNKLVPKDHYCWVGPFEFEEMFYLNCKPPSKYGWILPQFAKIDSIKTELLTQYQDKLPDMIVFRRDFQAFGQSTDYSKFFVEFLDKNYVRLWDMKEFKNYYFVDNHRKDFYLDADFNFEKSKAATLATKLAELGEIKAR